MEIKHITELEALEFVKKQNHKDEWHKDFHLWRKHLIILANKWPQLKQFYRGAGKWLGYFDKELKSTNPKINEESNEMAIHIWESRNMNNDNTLFGTTANERFKKVLKYLNYEKTN